MTGKAAIAGRGRKPNPNKPKKPNKSKQATAKAVEFEPIENIDPPDWLPELAQNIWRTVCPYLCEQKILTVPDLHNLEAFCSSYATWHKAANLLRLQGSVIEGASGGPIKNPAATVVNEALRQMQMFGSCLGLDPSSRGRLVGNTTGKGSNPFSDF